MRIACLDSNVLFGVLSGRLPGEILERYDQLLIPSTVVGEGIVARLGMTCRKQLGQRASCPLAQDAENW